MKKQVVKLNIDLNDSFFIIGISSHENDYRLSWAINQQLQFNFNKTPDFQITNKKTGEDLSFSVYQYEDENNFALYKLFSNTSAQGYLVEKLKNFDFIMKITGEIDIDFVERLNQQLKQIDIVSTTIIPDGNILKKLGFLNID